MPAPVAAAAIVGLPEAVKLASSVTAHISAALGTPLLRTETTYVRTTKRGTKTTTSSASLPAWAAVAAGVLFLWATTTPSTSDGRVSSVPIVDAAARLGRALAFGAF